MKDQLELYHCKDADFTHFTKLIRNLTSSFVATCHISSCMMFNDFFWPPIGWIFDRFVELYKEERVLEKKW